MLIASDVLYPFGQVAIAVIFLIGMAGVATTVAGVSRDNEGVGC